MDRKIIPKFGVSVDTSELEITVNAATAVLYGLGKTIEKLEKEFDEAFRDAGKDVQEYDRTISKVMWVLRRDLKQLRTAFMQVAEPIGIVLIPVLDLVVRKVTGIVQGVGLVLSALMGTNKATKTVEKAAKAEETLKKASVSAAAATKRSLAGFDKINRLNGSTGRAGGITDTDATQILPEKVKDTLSPQLRAVVDKIIALLEPVQKIDFSDLIKSMQKLGAAAAQLGSVLMEGLEWVWLQLMVPLATWVIEGAAPASVNVLTGAFRLLSAVLTPVLQGIGSLMPYLEPVISYIGTVAVEALNNLALKLESVALVFEQKGAQIQNAFEQVGQMIAAVWERIRPIMESMRLLWHDVTGSLTAYICSCVESAITVLSGFVGFITGTLSGNWSQAWAGMKTIFRGFVNGVIGLVNAMISGVVTGINSIIRALNQIRFTLPNWGLLGALAGMRFALNIPTVGAVQVPYLAQGAVLPANRPFLAMVGDQRHGTNVEAPLTTIQEAVALVMEDMIASNTAGQEMIIAVLRELLETVAGIQVGDEVIGRAVQRYNRKMAVVKGGYV